MSISSDRLYDLRLLLKERGYDAFLIQSADPHLGENIPVHWQIIPWLTGFTGSNATVVITPSFAGLWTDSRYFIQAREQLNGSGFSFMKQLTADRRDHMVWLEENLPAGSRIGLDGRIFSVSQVRKLTRLTETKNIAIDTEYDPFSEIWTDRPPVPASVAFEHELKYSGRERSEKISDVREIMQNKGADYQLLTSLDDIMWMLNIRGRDVEFSPLLTCFAVVGLQQVLLFVDDAKIPLSLAREFDRIDVVMLPYEETAAILSTLPSDGSILINPDTTSAVLYNSLPKGIGIIEDITIPTRLKALKNEVEAANIRQAMIRDGIALTRFFFKLETRMAGSAISELSLLEMLGILRAEQQHFLCPSFQTISAYNAHGALPHYSVTPGSDSVIGTNGILLLDSGGQYLDGTTDITRTVAIGEPTVQQKRDFTLVLQGMIRLASARFPAGTKGYQLDILARRALWENGLNYGHGTGHGVGYCLNVHEGPQNISPVGGSNSGTVIEPGMLVSDEPGLYREGEYGIRIENLLLCREDGESEFGRFLEFETLSLCYIERNLIETSMLEKRELEWLDDYHAMVFERISPGLDDDEKQWLKRKTDPLC